GGKTPVRNKEELVAELRKALDAATKFCSAQDVDLGAIEAVTGFDRVQLIGDAVDKLISPDPLRKEFLAHERLVRTLIRAVKPDPVALEFVSRVACLVVFSDELRLRTIGGSPANISQDLDKENAM